MIHREKEKKERRYLIIFAESNYPDLIRERKTGGCNARGKGQTSAPLKSNTGPADLNQLCPSDQLRLAESRSLRRVRVTGTGEPLCPPPARVACNAQFLPVPLNASLLRGSTCEEETTDWLSATDDTESRVNGSAESVFHAR